MATQEKTSIGYVIELLKTPIPFLTPARARRRAARKNLAKKSEPYSQPFFLSGAIEKGSACKFAIGGEDFVIDNDTWIFGEVRYGATASVKGERRGNQNFAKKIVMN